MQTNVVTRNVEIHFLPIVLINLNREQFEKIINAEERIDYVILCLLNKKMLFSDLCDVWNSLLSNFKNLTSFDRNYFVYIAQKCELGSITGL